MQTACALAPARAVTEVQTVKSQTQEKHVRTVPTDKLVKMVASRRDSLETMVTRVNARANVQMASPARTVPLLELSRVIRILVKIMEFVRTNRRMEIPSLAIVLLHHLTRETRAKHQVRAL